MELQLQELLNKIKNDGIAKAEKEANGIIENAKTNATVIIQNAKKEAEIIIDNAKNEVKLLTEAGEKSLMQAGRDLLISIQNKIISLFKHLINEDIKGALTPQLLYTMFGKIAQNWHHETHQALAILLNPNDLKCLEDEYISKLQKKFHNRFLFKPVDTIDKGFFIGENGKNTFYDFSDDGLTDIISQYLNPYLSSILKRAATSNKNSNE